MTKNKVRITFLITILIGLILILTSNLNSYKPSANDVDKIVQTYYLNLIRSTMMEDDVDIYNMSLTTWDCNVIDFNSKNDLDLHLTDNFIFDRDGKPIFDENSLKKESFKSILITPNGDQTKLINDELFKGKKILDEDSEYYYSITPNNLNPNSYYTICAKSDTRQTFYCLNQGSWGAKSIITLNNTALDTSDNLLDATQEIINFFTKFLFSKEISIVFFILLLTLTLKARFLILSVITSIVNFRPSIQFKKITNHISNTTRKKQDLKFISKWSLIIVITLGGYYVSQGYIKDKNIQISRNLDNIFKIIDTENKYLELFKIDGQCTAFTDTVIRLECETHINKEVNLLINDVMQLPLTSNDIKLLKPVGQNTDIRQVRTTLPILETILERIQNEHYDKKRSLGNLDKFYTYIVIVFLIFCIIKIRISITNGSIFIYRILSKYWTTYNLKKTQRILSVLLIWLIFLLGWWMHLNNEHYIVSEELERKQELTIAPIQNNLERIASLISLYKTDSEKEQDFTVYITFPISVTMAPDFYNEYKTDIEYLQYLSETQWISDNTENIKNLTNREIGFLRDIENIVINGQWITNKQQLEIKRIDERLAYELEKLDPYILSNQKGDQYIYLIKLIEKIAFASILLFSVMMSRWQYYNSIQKEQEPKILNRSILVFGVAILLLFVSEQYVDLKRGSTYWGWVTNTINNIQNTINKDRFENLSRISQLDFKNSIKELHIDNKKINDHLSDNESKLLKQIEENFNQYKPITDGQLKIVGLIDKKLDYKKNTYRNIQTIIEWLLLACSLLLTVSALVRWRIDKAKAQPGLLLRWGVVFFISIILFSLIWKFIEFEKFNRLIFIEEDHVLKNSKEFSNRSLVQLNQKNNRKTQKLGNLFKEKTNSMPENFKSILGYYGNYPSYIIYSLELDKVEAKEFRRLGKLIESGDDISVAEFKRLEILLKKIKNNTELRIKDREKISNTYDFIIFFSIVVVLFVFIGIVVLLELLTPYRQWLGITGDNQNKTNKYFKVIGWLLLIVITFLIVFIPIIKLQPNRYIEINNFLSPLIDTIDTFVYYFNTADYQQSLQALAIIPVVFSLIAILVILYAKKKLMRYVVKLAKGEDVELPKIRLQEFSQIAESIDTLLKRLKGKKYIETFINSIAHEIRTPLAGIRANTESLSLSMDSDNFAQSKDNIIESNSRMLLIINSLLELAKLEQQNKTLEKSRYDINNIIENIINEIDIVKKLKDKNISISFNKYNHCIAHANKVLIEMCLLNIINNAIDFSLKNSTIWINSTNSKNSISIEILDEGVGIPDNMLDKIQNKFVSTSRPYTNKRSTGLGISLVQIIMELHGGEFEINNRLNAEGVSATLTLPKQST